MSQPDDDVSQPAADQSRQICPKPRQAACVRSGSKLSGTDPVVCMAEGFEMSRFSVNSYSMMAGLPVELTGNNF